MAVFRTSSCAYFALAMLTIASASAQDKYAKERFVLKGDSLATAEQDVVREFAQEAVGELLPKPRTPREKSAFAGTLSEALRRANELVTYTIIDGPRERPGAPGYIVIRAEVSRADIETIYQAAMQSAKTERKYKVMVVMSEEHRKQRIEPIHTSWEIRPDSKVASAIERELIEAGYAVINGHQFAEIRQRKHDFSKLDGDDQKILQRIAANQGADIILHGNTKVDGPDARPLKGLDDIWYYWHADVTGSAYWVDTAQTICVIAFPDGPRERGHRVRDAGTALALEAAGQTVARQFIAEFKPGESRGEIQVSVLNVTEFEQSLRIEEWLESVAGSGAVHADWNNPNMEASLQTELSAKELAKGLHKIGRDPDGIYRLKIEKISINTIKAKIVPAG